MQTNLPPLPTSPVIPTPPTEETVPGIDRIKLKRSSSPYQPRTLQEGRWMDLERHKLATYEYLCHVASAKQWIETMIHEEIHVDSLTELDDEMVNGILLARLARQASPDTTQGFKIYNNLKGLHYRHTDNINMFLKACKALRLPEVYLFEVADLYEKKNFPAVIHCIHALSHLLAKRGLAPKIQDLVGQMEFSDKEIDLETAKIEASGIELPTFSGLHEIEAEPSTPMDSAYGTASPEPVESIPEEVPELIEEETPEQGMKPMMNSLITQKAWSKKYENDSAKIIKCQAIIKSRLAQKLLKQEKQKRLEELQRQEAATKIQSVWKGHQQASQYRQRLAYLASNLQAIVKIQSWYRGTMVRRDYINLLTLENPNIEIVSKFAHLIDDTQTDYKEEEDLTHFRQQLNEQVRLNAMLEKQVQELDVKIALFIRHRGTLDELVKMRQSMSSFSQLAASWKGSKKQTQEGDQWDLQVKKMFEPAPLDKESRQVFVNYQRLLYILRTEPNYLGRFLFLINKRYGLGTSGFVENVVLSLYGHATTPREELMLLRLICTAIRNEVKELNQLSDFWKTNPFFVKLVQHYSMGAQEKAYMKDLLGPLVKETIEIDGLCLDSDPLTIYNTMIREEEQETGKPTQKPRNVTPVEALRDEECQKRYAQNLSNLYQHTERFLVGIFNSLHLMPFGLRYIARQMLLALLEKFPDQQEEALTTVGNLVFFRFLSPVIVAPDMAGVVDGQLDTSQRKNLGEIVKLLQHIQYGKLVAQDAGQMWLTPLKEYVLQSYQRFAVFVQDVCTVGEAEDWFQVSDIDELNTPLESIYITPRELCQLHYLLQENLEDVCEKDPKDVLRRHLNGMGAVPFCFAGDYQAVHQTLVPPSPPPSWIHPVCVTLVKSEVEQDEQAFIKEQEVKQLWIRTKACIVDLLLCREASSLEELLKNDIQELDVNKYKELMDRRGLQGDLCKVQQDALQGLEQLKQSGRIKVDEDIIQTISKDIVSKNQRRRQRRNDLTKIYKTLELLKAKYDKLLVDKETFESMIDASIEKLSDHSKGKSRKVQLFSRHYWHMKKLEQQGKRPQFGSYKYNAQDLVQKGVILSVEGVNVKHLGQVTLVISSNEPGVFTVEGKLMATKVLGPEEIRLDELLQAQYEGVQEICLFEVARCNLNLLLHLLNKKFFA